MRFLALLNSEWRKISSTRMWWILAIIMVGYLACLAGGIAALFGSASGQNTQSAAALSAGDGFARLVYGFAVSAGYVFPVLLGALGTSSEFRHQTLTPTFLAAPRRGAVLTAKLIVYLLVGAVFGALAFIATVGSGALVVNGFGMDATLADSNTWALIGRGILAMALWAAIGTGLGALLRNQVAAIVVVLAFTQFVEPILRGLSGINSITANIGRFLPGAASDALVGPSFFSVAQLSRSEPLLWWQGGLVLLGLAAVFSIAGYLISWRRDIT